MFRVNAKDMNREFKRILKKYGFTENNAQLAADIFTKNSLSGVYSHGINRFPKVVQYLKEGIIDPNVEPTKTFASKAFQRWDGHRGFGPLNAIKAMKEACFLAKKYGIGIVALGNTNHWMRAGLYGMEAADMGCIGICWSNTKPNMPVWGGKDKKIGNNPIVFAVPKSDGKHLIIDCALSQYSYGKLEEYALQGKKLPYFGGFDNKGNLTKDAQAIYTTKRVLPIGYWKGSGISVLLDSIGAILTQGNTVHSIGQFENETGLSQIMIAIDAYQDLEKSEVDKIVESIIQDLKTSIPIKPNTNIYYPGELEASMFEKNLKKGIPVLESIWEELLNC